MSVLIEEVYINIINFQINVPLFFFLHYTISFGGMCLTQNSTVVMCFPLLEIYEN